MKKTISILLTIIILFNFSCIAFAERISTSVSLQIGNPQMYVNDFVKEIDPGLGTVPIIKNGRTLVPIRAIIEAFGGTVLWNDITQEVTLKLSDVTVIMTIGSSIAYKNNTPFAIDIAPIIHNDRTLLPIRHIAEAFNLRVAWDEADSRVHISGVSHIYSPNFSLADVPEYSGTPYTVINRNNPYFTSDEITANSYEYYSDLDYLGRCGVCIASIGQDIMPTGDRESISSVKPTGWQSIKYDIVSGKYLYNRCHLIGYQLSSENANKKNLITGTKYLNIEGMLPFEDDVADYVKATGNHVMYRVTPIFDNNNLVASGVLIEAYSVEDNGSGIKFCVYCYNVQPGININYSDGSSSLIITRIMFPYSLGYAA